jgi:peptidoglycan hydrolase-like protein with peptidoglycan-binding domain
MRGQDGASRPRRRAPFILGGVVVLLAIIGVGAYLVASSSPSLTADPSAIARVNMPVGGGTIERATVVAGPSKHPIPIQIQGDKIYPKGVIAAHTLLTVDVVVTRPGWISWLGGKRHDLHLTLFTPSAALKEHYLTLHSGAPVRLQFKQPVRVISYGSSSGALVRHVLSTPRTEVDLPRGAAAGSVWVAAAPRTWETSPAAPVSYFPAGAAATAIATPAPGTKITSGTPITLTFNKPVSSVLDSNMPPISPATPGSWHKVNSHTIRFVPEGYGYGLDANVSIPLPNGVLLVGGQRGKSAATGTWTVPEGSTLRLQQLLANLGYLPLRFKAHHGAHIALTAQAQEAAAIKPPAGHFVWHYDNVPSALRSFWKAGASGVMTRGAVMAFQSDHGFTPDGQPSQAVWKALINAVVAGKKSSFGYTFVDVSQDSETLNLWHSGHTVLSTPVNTGISSAPTANGTFPVYIHTPVTTMSGTNPDGSTYSDPGIPWVSYFNGGDALHGFVRGSYGSPQSLGCVEMPIDTAGKVYPYTPVGTLVNVT